MQVTFSGPLSGEDGETVEITVTKPDATTDTFSATLQSEAYSVTKEYVVAGDYIAKAHIDASAIYEAWDSRDVPFPIPFTPRTGDLNVTVA